MEEDEDLLPDLGDLDKAISISFTIDDKGKGLIAHSKPEIQCFLAKDPLATLTTPSSSFDPNFFTPLVRPAQELLNHKLEVLTMNESLQQKLFKLL